MKKKSDLTFEGKVTFYPEIFSKLKKQVIGGFDVSPVACVEIKKDKEECWGVCNPHKAEMWSVYVREKQGFAYCIADCENKITAKKMEKLLYLIMAHLKTPPPSTRKNTRKNAVIIKSRMPSK